MQPAIRKSSYLLLEVVCCLALVTLCLWPLLKPTLNLYIAKQQVLLKLNDQYLEKLALGLIKEKLYAHEFPFQHLRKGTHVPLIVENSVCSVHLKALQVSSKPSLYRIGLLVQVDLEFKKVNGTRSCSSHLVFIEGITC